VGVIEVGMGGEWDATNVVKADVSVIMPVDLDHQEYLGGTIAEIAATKAGIIKEGGFVVLAEQKPEAAVELLKKQQRWVWKSHVKELNTKLRAALLQWVVSCSLFELRKIATKIFFFRSTENTRPPMPLQHSSR
jgi:folylpolyglutamate synthase/dihydropteroate synthase